MTDREFEAENMENMEDTEDMDERELTDEQAQALLEELAPLAEDVPPMPEGTHEGWVRAIEAERGAAEDAPGQPARRKPGTGWWVKALGIAAALIFVIGGTLLTRDSLNARAPAMAARNEDRTSTADPREQAYEELVAENESLTYITQTAEEIRETIQAMGVDSDGAAVHIAAPMEAPMAEEAAEWEPAVEEAVEEAAEAAWESEEMGGFAAETADAAPAAEPMYALMAEEPAEAPATPVLSTAMPTPLPARKAAAPAATAAPTPAPTPAPTESPAETVTDPDPGPGAALLDFLRDMLVFLRAALPYLAGAAVLGIALRLILRKRKGKH